MLALVSLHAFALTVAPNDPRLFFEGRWKVGDGSVVADWPCSGVRFAVAAGTEGATLRVTWAGVRTRINATVTSGGTTSSAVWKGPELELPFQRPEQCEMRLPPGSSLVSLRKLSSATPYSTGIATDFFHASRFDLRGLEFVSGNATIEAVPARPRRIEVIGASDSAGYCVDGTPNASTLDDTLLGWKYSDCDGAAGAELARRLDAELSVQALAGAGLTQNANAQQRWQMGKLTMADYYTRTLQSDAKSPWNMSAHTPPQACAHAARAAPVPRPCRISPNLPRRQRLQQRFSINYPLNHVTRYVTARARLPRRQRLQPPERPRPFERDL